MAINLPSWAKAALAIVVAAGLGYAFGRYAQPAKEVIKTVEVVKTVTVVQHDTVTVIKEIKKPDGTTETDTTITDKDKDTTNSVAKDTTSETISNLKPQWFATLGVGMGSPSLTEGLIPIYHGSINRRILGPVYVGVWGNEQSISKVEGGVQLGLEF